ncbi:hypothetical protein HG535_0C01200 [Zygotorulaspora mrakii]|uniref:Uncharacterized protein n=1 Tax=Zygotorulaspora mrakii TaxID=42260 RepID=A0A7H9AZJ0_ZYGMR|nr:uncharacterized protein HG535_0C01200 [Zygotorulaspora mrakii]QLG71771.1 hypothetical protein HG535_0C01200 [Zygotorulaspora mrakii]
MNPIFVRNLHKAATRLAAYSEPAHQGITPARWFSTLGGVGCLLAGGALVVAYRNNDQHSSIRQIFRNERGHSGVTRHD